MLEIFWLLPLATLFQEGECSKKREKKKKEKNEEIKRGKFPEPRRKEKKKI